MGTVAALIDNARYDLQDYETGVEFDDVELLVYINRLIEVIDSTLISLRSELVFGYETELDTVTSQKYMDLTNMNNGQWDSLRAFWIGDDQLYHISLDNMYYKRYWYSGDAQPLYYATSGFQLLFETGADDAHTDVTIHYNKKHRPRLSSYSQAVTATAATDILTPATTPHTFVTGDGPFQFTNSGGALPTGISASTNYWLVYEPDIGSASFQLATSKVNAIERSLVDISTTGSGTHTMAFTSDTDMMPYDGRFDDQIRDMLSIHARSRKAGQIAQPEQLFKTIFNRRAVQETIRKNTIPKRYSIDY